MIYVANAVNDSCDIGNRCYAASCSGFGIGILGDQAVRAPVESTMYAYRPGAIPAIGEAVFSGMYSWRQDAHLRPRFQSYLLVISEASGGKPKPFFMARGPSEKNGKRASEWLDVITHIAKRRPYLTSDAALAAEPRERRLKRRARSPRLSTAHHAGQDESNW